MYQTNSGWLATSVSKKKKQLKKDDTTAKASKNDKQEQARTDKTSWNEEKVGVHLQAYKSLLSVSTRVPREQNFLFLAGLHRDCLTNPWGTLMNHRSIFSPPLFFTFQKSHCFPYPDTAAECGSTRCSSRASSANLTGAPPPPPHCRVCWEPR